MKKFLLIILSCMCHIIYGQNYNYYFGNLHAHSSYSDGNKDSLTSLLTTPFQDFNYAKNSQHIDFYGISEHNHSLAGLSSPSIYHKGIRQAKEASVEGSFIALYGMEWGVISSGGHVIIYGYDSLLIGWENGNFDVYNSQYDYTSLWKKINKKPNSFAFLAHPSNGNFDNLYTNTYNSSYDSAIVGTPYKSGPAFSTNSTYSNPATGNYISKYTDALKKGYHIGIGLDHDTHNSVFGRQTAGRLVVMAKALTQNDLFDAFKCMRFYASDDWNTEVNFTLNNQPMGSIISNANTANISVTITDPDLENTSSIVIYYGVPGSNIVASVLTSTTNTNSFSYNHNLSNNTTYYYYVKITQSDGNVIYTSPIWYNRNDLITEYPPQSAFSISTTTNCVGTINLTDASSGSPTSWFWNMPGSIPTTSTLQNPTANYSNSGIKNITLITSNASGSSAPITQTVAINVCEGIEELNSKNISVYPNPANDHLSIILNNINSGIITLFDVLGNEVMNINFTNSTTDLSLKQIVDGTYFLKIVDEKNNMYTKLIMVSHR